MENQKEKNLSCFLKSTLSANVPIQVCASTWAVLIHPSTRKPPGGSQNNAVIFAYLKFSPSQDGASPPVQFAVIKFLPRM